MRPNRHLSLTSRTESRYNRRRMGIQINCHHTCTTRVLDRIRTKPHWFFWLAFVVAAACLPDAARAQSPELSIREFSSGQMKKGVRSIGFGGDGATWGTTLSCGATRAPHSSIMEMYTTRTETTLTLWPL